MNIAKIVSITQNGRPWSFTDDKGTQKTMYPHDVAFDDHQSGQANAMSVPPPYKVGESVGYEINGQTPRGANKVKITRNPKPGQGVVTSPPPMDTSNPDLEAATPPSRREDAWHQPHPHSGKPQVASYPPDAWHQPHPQKPAEAARTPVHGATVGGAIARAVEVAIALNRPDDLALIEKLMHGFISMQLLAESGAKGVGNAPQESGEIPF